MDNFVLRNAKQVSGKAIDIYVADGKIEAWTPAGERSNPHTAVYDCSGMFVSSGWIDMHVHAFSDFSPYGDEIDEIGVKLGVTTIVDAGSCGADRISILAARGVQAATNLLAFLNISRIGLDRTDELSNLNWIDRAQVMESVQQYPEFIVGLKARISNSVVRTSGIEPLHIARELSQASGKPLMVHIGSGPPDIKHIVPLLEKKDIITHYLNGKKNNLFDEQGRPIPQLTEAIARGVHLDVGHGRASFSFKIAEAAKRHNIRFNTISTDIYRDNRLNGPVYSMANLLTKFLYLGYPLEEIIAAVTTRAADWLGRPELGRIQVGDAANLTLFSVADEAYMLIDSEGEQREADRLIKVRGAVVNGNFFEC
ncbi:amidohydrolase/deacetylase family metallohydrolase [Paenibacillus sp. GCM10027626]|uniref:amidohydrolase/deacetylase family metallohydrolase n=1 Tax=Paenibacillus sp. GCM10027626 TaxID=3273411 RepID=UPI003638FE06